VARSRIVGGGTRMVDELSSLSCRMHGRRKSVAERYGERAENERVKL